VNVPSQFLGGRRVSIIQSPWNVSRRGRQSIDKIQMRLQPCLSYFPSRRKHSRQCAFPSVVKVSRSRSRRGKTRLKFLRSGFSWRRRFHARERVSLFAEGPKLPLCNGAAGKSIESVKGIFSKRRDQTFNRSRSAPSEN